MLSAFGHNPTIAVGEFSGELTIPGGDPGAGSLQFRADAASLSVTGDVKEKDRSEIERVMHRDVLESAAYPQITFASRHAAAEETGGNQYRVRVGGALELHGITRDEEVTVYLTLSEDQARAYGEVALLQSNYAIRPVSFAGGALKLKDELRFSFDFVMDRTGS